MKPEYQAVMDSIKEGKPYKMLLKDGSSFTFDKQGRNSYKMVLRNKYGIKAHKSVVNESGLIHMFERFSEKASYLNLRES